MVGQGQRHGAAHPDGERVTKAIWPDRRQAGRELAEHLLAWDGQGHTTTVVAVPRGGVAVAVEVARRLRLPITTWSVRKLSLPDNPELAIGAIGPGEVELWDDRAERLLAGQPERRQRVVTAARLELERRRRLFGDAAPAELRGRQLIVVDDGVATGLTVCAALDSLRALSPASLILAVPVVDREVKGWLAGRVDTMVALAVVRDLQAVGLHYHRFEQLDDSAVLSLLAGCRGG